MKKAKFSIDVPRIGSSTFAVASFFGSVVAISAAQTPIGSFPFSRDGQLVVVEVRIDNAAPVLFMLDSGASHTVFDPTFATELGLETKEALPTTGTGSGAIAKSHTRAVVMTFGEVKVDVAEPRVIDLSHAPMPPVEN